MRIDHDYRPCPRCSCRRTVRWGQYPGGQRYRCRGCRRTFTLRTASPRAYTKLPDEWAPYLDLMERRATLREIAAELDIHICTAFRWRHALLSRMARMRLPPLSGPVELGTAPIALNEKGCRDLDGDARRRGGRSTGLLEPGVDRTHIAIAISPLAGIRTGHIQQQMIGSSEARQFIEQNVAPDQPVVFATTPWKRSFILAGKRAGYDVTPELWAPSVDAPQLFAYRRRLRDWLTAFRGVGTRYVDNYLRWHHAVELAMCMGRTSAREADASLEVMRDDGTANISREQSTTECESNTEPAAARRIRTESHAEQRAEAHAEQRAESHAEQRAESHAEQRAESHAEQRAEAFAEQRPEALAERAGRSRDAHVTHSTLWGLVRATNLRG
jgi:transposase-like protein